MCKKIKGCGRRIDPCMQEFIGRLKQIIKGHYKMVACCCGHRKYNMTIVIKANLGADTKFIFELFSGITIPRKTRFYKKDKEGYYYIPECIK